MFVVDDPIRCQIIKYELMEVVEANLLGGQDKILIVDPTDPNGSNLPFNQTHIHNVLQVASRTDLLTDPVTIDTDVPMTNGRVRSNKYFFTIKATAQGGAFMHFAFDLTIDICKYE